MIKADEKGHRTRFSDSSIYDEVCVLCGATDAWANMTKLLATCPEACTDEEYERRRTDGQTYERVVKNINTL